jgi:hypothetical protein
VVTQFELSRQYWDFAFENTDLVTPTHAALYFYCIDLYNRLGWAEKFGLPSENTMTVLGIKKGHTYNKYLNDLVQWGFIKMVEKSKNQHTANIIAMPKNGTPNGKAHGKAHGRAINLLCQKTADHAARHRASNGHGTGHINKPNNLITLEPNNITDSNESGETKKNNSSKSEKKETTPHWKILVETWFNFYEQKKGEKPTFKGAAPKDLKAILENLQKRAEERGAQWTEEIAVATFLSFLKFAHNTDWIPNNFLLSNLNRQFDKIITSKNGKQTSNNKNAGIDEYQRQLAERMAEITGTGGDDTTASSW